MLAAPPHLADVGYSAVSRVETRAWMAQSGDAEFVFGLDPASVSRRNMLESADRLSRAIPRARLIKGNAGHPFLSEPEARRARSLAIGRTGIAGAMLRYPEGAGTHGGGADRNRQFHHDAQPVQ
ncbi:hypothetical protein [Salipiger sp. 1_MG-2023]|uniref:hypothetical protein n=1 Tax=Salipiger sp. 1_MG-2023 TaxID=3062665 RepID=UPI0026E2684A|nr:hypothetical protein [Salipiger sp. 1_MG-2023]